MKYYGVTIQMKPFGQNFWVLLFISDSFGIFAKIYLSVNDLLSTLIPLISLFFLILLEACAWSFYLTRMSWHKPTSLLPSREIKVMSHGGYSCAWYQLQNIIY